jgi:hypothetical protein
VELTDLREKELPGLVSSTMIDTSVPHSARLWNYLLGGKDNYPVDRDVGEAILKRFPGLVDGVRVSRHFQCRVIRSALEKGIGQFLEVGVGLPTVDNTHEVAQRVDPKARIVYADTDPLVLSHAHALFTGQPGDGAVDTIDADVRDPDRILAKAAAVLDMRRPVLVLMMGVLGQVGDQDAAAAVRHLMAGCAVGSYLAIADFTTTSPGCVVAFGHYNATGAARYQLRSPAQLEACFSGLQLLDPGITAVEGWRPDLHDPTTGPQDASPGAAMYGGVARKAGPTLALEPLNPSATPGRRS